MVLPYLEVSHLASSSSFYSSVLQPLGLRYLNTGREKSSSVGTVTYGFPAQGRRESLPILQIREASRPFEPLKHSFLVLGASSPATVAEFYDCAVASNPWQHLKSEGDGFSSGSSSKHHLGIEGGVSPARATVRDLDGNIIQVIPVPPTAQHDAGQVLQWDYDVASRSKHTRTRSQSHPLPSPVSSSASSHTKSQAPFQPNPRSLVSTRSSHSGFGPPASAPMSQRAPSQVAEEEEPLDEPSVSPRQSSSGNGLSTTTVVGAILGVAAGAAAGAALTYNMVTRERDRKPRHDIEPPNLPRRSTFPEKAPSVHHRPRPNDRAPAYPGYPPKALPYRSSGPYEQQALPAPLPYTEEFPFRQPVYNDDYESPRKLMYEEKVTVTPKKLSYPDDYTPRRMPYDDDDDDDDDDSDEPPRPAPSRHTVEYLTEDPLLDSSRSTAARSRARSTAGKSTAGKSTAARSTATKSIAHSTARSTAARSAAAKSTAARSTATKSIAHSVAHSTARSTAKSTARSLARSTTQSRIPDEIEETRSRHSSRHSHVSGRSRSEAPAPRGSLFMGDGDHRSYAGSRHSVATKSTYSRARSQRPSHDPERDTYVSTRSHRSSAGVRHPPPPEVQTEVMEAPEAPEAPEDAIYDDYEDYEHVPRGPELMIRNRDGSKYSVARLSQGGEPPIIMSHGSLAPSHVSARKVSLPMSGVGSSHADWDDDIISLAPSDSISCVGSKTSRRSRRVR